MLICIKIWISRWHNRFCFLKLLYYYRHALVWWIILCGLVRIMHSQVTSSIMRAALLLVPATVSRYRGNIIKKDWHGREDKRNALYLLLLAPVSQDLWVEMCSDYLMKIVFLVCCVQWGAVFSLVMGAGVTSSVQSDCLLTFKTGSSLVEICSFSH